MSIGKMIDAALDDYCKNGIDGVPAKYCGDLTDTYRNKVFNRAGNVFDIQGQMLENDKITGDEFSVKYRVRKTGVVNLSTGEHRGDDWQRLYFEKKFNYIPLGMKLWFDDNVWLVFNTDIRSKIVANCVVHRCSLLMRKKLSDGRIIKEPCFFTSYKTIQNRVYQTENTNISNPEDTVIAQFNDFTKTVKVNDRFIFGENEYAQAWRVKAMLPFVRGKTYDNDSRCIIAFVMERTQVKSTDDIINGIADNTEYSSAPAEKNENDGNNAHENKTGFNIEIIPVDNEYAVEQYDTKKFTAYVYEDGKTVDTSRITDMRFEFKGADESFYRIFPGERGNDITIQCRYPCNEPLEINFMCTVDGEELSGQCMVMLDGNI